jgi:hypothetical protein
MANLPSPEPPHWLTGIVTPLQLLVSVSIIFLFSFCTDYVIQVVTGLFFTDILKPNNTCNKQE